jgi:hypothetical protein
MDTPQGSSVPWWQQSAHQTQRVSRALYHSLTQFFVFLSEKSQSQPLRDVTYERWTSCRILVAWRFRCHGTHCSGVGDWMKGKKADVTKCNLMDVWLAVLQCSRARWRMIDKGAVPMQWLQVMWLARYNHGLSIWYSYACLVHFVAGNADVINLLDDVIDYTTD